MFLITNLLQIYNYNMFILYATIIQFLNYYKIGFLTFEFCILHFLYMYTKKSPLKNDKKFLQSNF